MNSSLLRDSNHVAQSPPGTSGGWGLLIIFSLKPWSALAARDSLTIPPEIPAPRLMQEVPAIQLTPLKPYVHSSGLLSIEVPQDWKVEDRSQDGILNITFLDPSERIQIRFVIGALDDTDVILAPIELGLLLDTLVTSSFQGESNLSVDVDSTPLEDGSVGGIFTYDTKGVRMLGNAFIQQYPGYRTLTYIVLPQVQFDGLVDELNWIMNSYRIDPSAGFDF